MVNLLTFVSSVLILLQLLSKQIGISGHIHRLMAGSMAGDSSSKAIRRTHWFAWCQLDIMCWPGNFFLLTHASFIVG